MSTSPSLQPGRSLAIALLLVAAAMAALFALAPHAAATTYSVSGHLTTTQTWNSSDTYILSGNVTVDGGVTLTIQPGAHVLANTATRIYVVGTLQANGNATAPVNFSANGNAPRWGGIQFNASAAGSVTWSTFDRADAAVTVVASSPGIAHNEVTRASTAFRFIGSNGVDLAFNTVDRASLVGVDIAGSNGMVQGNAFYNTSLGIQARGAGTLSILGNTIANVSTPGASVALYVDGLTAVTLDGNTVQDVHGPKGGPSASPGGRGSDGALAVGLFVNATGLVSLANNVVTGIAGGAGGDGQANGLGNGGSGGSGGSAVGILVLSAQTANLQADWISNVTGGRGGNGGASTAAIGGNGGNGGAGGSAAGLEAYNLLSSATITGETAGQITGGAGGQGGAPAGTGHVFGAGGPGADAYGIGASKALSLHLSGSTIQTILGGRGGNSTNTLLLTASTRGGIGGQAVGIGVLGADGPASNPTTLHGSVVTSASGGPGGMGYASGGNGGNATGILVFADGKPFNASTVSGSQVSSLVGGYGGASHDVGGNGGGAIGIVAFHITPTFLSNSVAGLLGGNGGSAAVTSPAGAGGQAAGIGVIHSLSGMSSADTITSVANGSAGIGKAPPAALCAGIYVLGNDTERAALTMSNGTISGVSGYDLYVDNYTHVTTISTTFGWSSVQVELNGNLTIRNFLTVQPLWPDNITPVTGASIQVRDDTKLAWNVTSPGSPVPWLLVTDRVYYGGKGFHDNKTNVSVSFAGAAFLNDPRFVNMSSSHTERFVLRDLTAPVSSANALPRYETSRTFPIAYTASDPSNGTGIKNITLWYRTTGTDWIRFQTLTTPAPGQFLFTATADGPYAFVTIATDNANLTQPFPVNNNTWTIVDTVPPASHVLPAPRFENHLSFGLQWQANAGTTDAATFTIETNAGSGWAAWLVNTTATSGAYTAAGQGVVAFRSIAWDFAGNMEAKTGNDTWTVVDTVPPTILATSPNGTGASTGGAIVITFSEPMNTTATQAAFGLSPSATGSFTWSGGGSVLTFQPSSSLASGTAYTVTVATSAADLAGNSLAQPAVFRFTTAAPAPSSLSLDDLWPLLVAVAVIAAALLLFVVLRRRGQAAETVAEPPAPAAAPAVAKQEAAMDDVFLLYRKDGVLIKHETRRLRPDIDTDILSGMLTAVQQFVKDSFRGDEGEELNEMTVGQMHILIGRGKWLILAATITGGDVESMTSQIRKCVLDMEEHNWDRLEDWDGDMDLAKALAPYLKRLIRGVYAG